MKKDRCIEEVAAMYYGDSEEITKEVLELLTSYKNQGLKLILNIDEHGLKISAEKEVDCE